MFLKTMKKLTLLLLFLIGNSSYAQETNKVLMHVAGDAVPASEFLRVYNKNLDLVKDESQKEVDSYLQLFTEYQLKLKEARRLKLDQEAKYKREFARYKAQLTKNYLSENKVTDELVKEAYERSKYDVEASHILVRLDESERDTLNTYNEVLALRERLMKEGFENLKNDVHDGKRVFVEDLGYFSAFKMVYGFETAAYNTEPGDVSLPFRTQFGYHVVSVRDRRPSRGTITAAHIMIALNQQDSTLKPEIRIQEIYSKLKQGESFEALAKQFSDDKSSARNGGVLAAFKSGQLSSEEFEDQAFGLNNDGDYSEPFKTAYGWHIVKRIKLEPLKDFDGLKPSLESKVKRDSRSKLINAALVKELKIRYDIEEDKQYKSYFVSILNDDFFNRSWKSPEDIPRDKMLFKINDRTYTYDQFGRFLEASQRVYFNKKTELDFVIEEAYANFFERSILKFREDNLEEENEEFANIIKEYREGLLLFDLMEKEVWNKASKDSIGLRTYYEAHKSEYKWKERVDVVIVSSADKIFVEQAKEFLENQKTEEVITKALNTEGKQNVIFTNGVYTVDDPRLPKAFKVEQGVSSIYEHNQSYHVIQVNRVLPSGTKSFQEARGAVINDYQAQIEEQWLKDLKSRYPVDIDKRVFKEIKEQIDRASKS
jgi:peptidyl-prolyl cis-trans isomerase SurA